MTKFDNKKETSKRNLRKSIEMKWITISCILCVFGCFKEYRPSESFVTNYLTGPWKNFTDTQVSVNFVYKLHQTKMLYNF